ncbi:hypothetical protein KAJ87_03685 [Candidatus Pacearchaeota archaeon]|nr:hypothetical protein [Candidatus Pacearchaeota archaeon]
MLNDYVNLNEFISYVNGGTELSDLDEGEIYELGRRVNYNEQKRSLKDARKWNNENREAVMEFKEKYNFSNLQK